jgi:hypothetical protein
LAEQVGKGERARSRRLLAERREIVEELERAKRDYLGGAKGPSV